MDSQKVFEIMKSAEKAYEGQGVIIDHVVDGETVPTSFGFTTTDRWGMTYGTLELFRLEDGVQHIPASTIVNIEQV
jgi:hypothetical protein